MAMHEFHFHEDQPGQIAILPFENWDHCQREFIAIDEHAERHLAPGGVGWTKMYTPLPTPVPLDSLQITEEQFCEWLAPHGRRFDRVVDPIFGGEVPGIRCVGFGPSSYRGIIAERRDEDAYIPSIWCSLTGFPTDENRELAALLTALSRDHHLMLVDWLEGVAVDLRSPAAIERYLNGDDD